MTEASQNPKNKIKLKLRKKVAASPAAKPPPSSSPPPKPEVAATAKLEKALQQTLKHIGKLTSQEAAAAKESETIRGLAEELIERLANIVEYSPKLDLSPTSCIPTALCPSGLVCRQSRLTAARCRGGQNPNTRSLQMSRGIESPRNARLENVTKKRV